MKKGKKTIAAFALLAVSVLAGSLFFLSPNLPVRAEDPIKEVHERIQAGYDNRDREAFYEAIMDGVELGDPMSYYMAGNVYLVGALGIYKDLSLAVSYYELAVEAGRDGLPYSAWAAEELESIYLFGNQSIAADVEKAEVYYRMIQDLQEEKDW